MSGRPMEIPFRLALPWDVKLINAALRLNVWCCVSARLYPHRLALRIAETLGSRARRRMRRLVGI